MRGDLQQGDATADVDLTSVDLTVIVATKGRRPEVTGLLACLERQSLLPRRVFVIGTCQDDFDASVIAAAAGFECRGWIARRAGTTAQRNEGVERLREQGHLDEASIIVFFDDDFRPAADWLERCVALLRGRPDVHAMTGHVLADGVHGAALSDADADRYISGAAAPEPHWASGQPRDIGSLYGCNMAFRSSAFLACRFDEELPLYGWQEDRDISGQVRRAGRVVFDPGCRGVHLGAGGGRSSGLRFGYAQVANVLYLGRKGTVEVNVVLLFLLRAVCSNVLHAIRSQRKPMYAQRLRGNVLAFTDLLRGTCYPRRIVDLP